MSKIAKDDNEPVTEDDIARDYRITQDVMIGSETEHVILKADGGLIDQQEHERLKAVFNAAAIAVSDEPAACIFEIKSRAGKNPEALIAEVAATNARLEEAVRKEGHIMRRTGYLGHVTLDDAYRHRMAFERSDGLLEHMMAEKNGMPARHPLMSSSIHVSLSYADIGHLYELARLLMVLTPALTAMCENTEGLIDGQPVACNPSAAVRLSHSRDHSGIPTSIAEGQDAEDMIRRHAHHIFTTPMMMHIGQDSVMRPRDASGQSPTLQDLAAKGLNTRSNAMVSESMQYHMLKLTSLRNGEGKMTGKRLELRMADNGPYQHDFMVLLTAAIARDAAFRKKLAETLKHAGLAPFSPASGPLAMAALDQVAADRSGGLRIAYGRTTTGGVAAMLCNLMAQHYAKAGPAAHTALALAGQRLKAGMEGAKPGPSP